MSAEHASIKAHSSIVVLELHVAGLVLPIAQMGLDFVELRTPVEYPPSDAEIFMSIDGRARRWPVRLSEGISATSRRTKIASQELLNGATDG